MGLAEKTADLSINTRCTGLNGSSVEHGKPVPQLGKDMAGISLDPRKEMSKERLPDKTIIGKYIRTASKDPQQVGKTERAHACIAFLRTLHPHGLSPGSVIPALVKHSDIHFHLVNPAPSVYWFEDRSEKQLAFLNKKGFRDKSEPSQGNTLLSSWGRVIQDTFMMLFNNELLNTSKRSGWWSP